MLDLRGALKTELGASFTVSHVGPDNVTRNVTVRVVDAGIGDYDDLPVVRFVGEFGNTEATNIGGGGAAHDHYADIHIVTIDGPEWYGPRLLVDIHKELESRIRAVEKSVGSSFFTIASSHRDFPPRSTEAAPYWYTRYVMVRGVSVETY